MTNFDVHDSADHKAKVVLSVDFLLKKRIAYSGNNPIYIGWAKDLSAATSESKWSIKKLTYSGYLVTEENFADGVNDFTKEWDERASYTYS